VTRLIAESDASLAAALGMFGVSYSCISFFFIGVLDRAFVFLVFCTTSYFEDGEGCGVERAGRGCVNPRRLSIGRFYFILF
jgi:hypothetical protein